MSDPFQPGMAKRRSPVYRLNAAAGARFVAYADSALVADYGDPAAEREAAHQLGLCDLSVLPRIGFKGAGTRDWLAARGVVLPEATNLARPQADGAVAAQLGPQEILLLSDLAGQSTLAGDLMADWHASDVGSRGFPVPRRETHAWFCISGVCAAAMFAKMSAIDLRPHRFANYRLTQTSIARATGIIIRNDIGSVLAYDLLVDWTMADYYLPVLLDAMAEFDGRLIGHVALSALAETAA
ncbi:MAG: sarcosine oxidase [Proteobacteria bacterium]|nr:sarcosine oxidase [Pseudomonadota bacterium]